MVAARFTPSIYQNLISASECIQPIAFTLVKEPQLESHHFAVFNESFTIGLSPGYSKSGFLRCVAIADKDHILVVELSKHDGSNDDQKGRGALKSFLTRSMGDLNSFDMATLSMALADLSLPISNAVDINAAFKRVAGSPATSVSFIMEQIIGHSGRSGTTLNKQNVLNAFQTYLYADEDPNRAIIIGNRAWLAFFAASYEDVPQRLASVKRIDTLSSHSPDVSQVVRKLVNDRRRATEIQPLQTSHRFETRASKEGSGVDLRATQYKTKFQQNNAVDMVVRNADGTTYVERSTISGVHGRAAQLSTSTKHLGEKEIVSIVSKGRDGPTRAERERSKALLSILQGNHEVLTANPWIKNIWMPTDGQISWPPHWPIPASKEKFNVIEPPSSLNRSQKGAVKAMLSKRPDARFVILEGPPGSGKTSVIGSYVRSAVAAKQRGLWLIAQSNVAVKNIAEKLCSLGFLDFRLLVSEDFHLEWHEHIYQNIPRTNTIISSEFRDLPFTSFRDIPVYLCTLSMLSNAFIKKFTTCNPIKTLVIDEASQIEIGGYLPVLNSASATLQKMCFIGDDKQLPPHGADEIESYHSVFEVEHFKDSDEVTNLSLDTQYRMPPQVGEIISRLVYNGELQSNPKHPIDESKTACFFYHTAGTEVFSGKSYINEAECHSVLILARYLQAQELAYKVITPYDGQRNLVEEMMKSDEELEWENKCFNVDSFQGNEEDYIIVSLVRSRELGFLRSLRRTNVMLTRFRKGMFIVSSKYFLGSGGRGRDSLAGELLHRLGPKVKLVAEQGLVSGNVF